MSSNGNRGLEAKARPKLSGLKKANQGENGRINGRQNPELKLMEST